MASQHDANRDRQVQRIAAWLRDTTTGQELIAKAAARMCQKCPRVAKLTQKCKECEYQQHTKTSEILDRIPPHSLEAEQGVIGSVLLMPEVYRKIKPPLNPEDFYSLAHEILWRHISTALDNSDPLDMTLLTERLKKVGEWDVIGGAVYLAEVLRSVAVAAHAPHYAAIIREKAALRRLIWSLCLVLKGCYEHDAALRSGPVAEGLAKLVRIVQDLDRQ